MDDQNLIRINKFLSEVGFCSRRAADTLVEEGRVTANGVVCVMGSKVTRDDEIRVNGNLVSAPKEKHVYIAFNKPMGIVCTTDVKAEKDNIIDYIKHLFLFTAHESCGKCFPCRIGSTRGYELLEKATSSDYKIDLALMNDLLETLEIGSLCALGGGLPLPVKNAMMYFKEELQTYFK